MAAFYLALLSSPLHAGMFTYSDFSSTSGLNLVSSAAQLGSHIRLNPAVEGVVGALWYTTKVDVEAGFETTFDFRIIGMAGSTDEDSLLGGDGLAFVVQNTSDTAIGPTNFYMGYEIANSLAVEFDTWRNPNFLTLEPSSNHVGVQSLGTAVNSPFEDAYLVSANVGPDMSDGGVHTATIKYVPGSLTVYVDDLINPVLTLSVDLGALLDLSSGQAYVGFTAGGAGAFEKHDLLSWSFRSIPEPGGFVSMILGSLALGAWRRSRPRFGRGGFTRQR